jgi:hypothetical protein
VTGAFSVNVCKPSNMPVLLHVAGVLEARKLLVELALVTSTPNELVPIHILAVLKPSTVLVANRGARRSASMEYSWSSVKENQPTSRPWGFVSA